MITEVEADNLVLLDDEYSMKFHPGDLVRPAFTGRDSLGIVIAVKDYPNDQSPGVFRRTCLVMWSPKPRKPFGPPFDNPMNPCGRHH